MMRTKHQRRVPTAGIKKRGPGPSGRERVVLSYCARRDNEPPHRYWTFVETDKGTIYATGDTRQLLESDIVDCAAMLGYDRNSVVLVAMG
ncbi:hypothetical protein psal_cds_1168 [Pandoravirus salinus]|uniref:Uncharacterized protein n=1 Tax=Pandoravirus salinus TaxID=1349410 RepID=S4VYK8_9VIRU|nr:hypothetical protein psal_cds_1168 [Pandoravirus salinus]AGO85443.1 hypothetical protein psal_cds_1168 [Pandoravirus salinus]